MKDTMPQVARYWNDIAQDFDAIYSGKKGAFGRMLDQWLRKDIYQRYINPEASNRQLIWASYISSALLILTGLIISIFGSSINTAFLWR